MPARLTVAHLSGRRGGEVEEVVLPAVLGSAFEADVRVPEAAERHAVVFEREGEIVLQDSGSGRGTLLDGEPVQEAVLREGDVVRLGASGPELRLRSGGEDSEALLGSVAFHRPRGPFGPVLAFLRDAVGYVRPPLRWLLGGLFVLALAAVGWSHLQSRRLEAEVARLREALVRAEREREGFNARIEEERRREAAERAALEGRLEDLRQREESLRQKLAEAAAGEVQALRTELGATRERLGALESERAVGERIIRDFGPGVCLLQGAYAFFDQQGRPLRYRLDESGAPVNGPDGEPLLDPEGTGPVHSVEYVGTGFLVDRRGIILTNRHLAEPWWNDAQAQALAAAGTPPRLTLLRAFFPRQPEPFPLTLERHAEKADLALLKVDLGGRRVPLLPLDRSGRGAVPGQAVVVVGYPAGIEAILAKADSGVVREILAASGMNMERVAEALAKRGLIRPSTTQGHIGDITETDIVFDAPTTVGGSGGPVLNRNGVVIGVEYAVLSRFGGNSFGVPIRHAIALLRPPKPEPK